MSEWRDIKGYEGLYQVSRDGEIRSLERVVTYIWKGKIKSHTIKERVLKPGKDTMGYRIVTLCKEGNKTSSVHRLVANNFLDNPENLPEVNHIDGDKWNSKCGNLEWCSSSDNSRHSYATGLQSKREGADHSGAESFSVTWEDGTIETFKGLYAYCRENGLQPACMNKLRKGERKTPHRGVIRVEKH